MMMGLETPGTWGTRSETLRQLCQLASNDCFFEEGVGAGFEG